VQRLGVFMERNCASAEAVTIEGLKLLARLRMVVSGVEAGYQLRTE